MTRLIGLMGAAGVGKDEAAAALLEGGLCDIQLSFAEVLYSRLGWTRELAMEIKGTNEVEYRRLLDKVNRPAPLAHVKNQWEHLLQQGRAVVVSDVRTQAEYDAIVLAGGYLMRVERPGRDNMYRAIAGYPDAVVMNQGSLAVFRSAVCSWATEWFHAEG